ncbi:hypothetical protein FQA39_LY08067 [Lamprigera yunnana]|nr:hypothetical protein FQA39_LY08067 [Lamprigera yunnana]
MAAEEVVAEEVDAVKDVDVEEAAKEVIADDVFAKEVAVKKAAEEVLNEWGMRRWLKNRAWPAEEVWMWWCEKDGEFYQSDIFLCPPGEDEQKLSLNASTL